MSGQARDMSITNQGSIPYVILGSSVCIEVSKPPPGFIIFFSVLVSLGRNTTKAQVAVSIFYTFLVL